jgi:hypothetical protein
MPKPIPADEDQAVYRLRILVGEEDYDTSPLDRDLVVDILGRHTDLEGAAAEFWGVKASRFANLVNVSEGGSKRDLGTLAAQARAQAEFWEARSDEVLVVEGAARTTTRAIERA